MKKRLLAVLLALGLVLLLFGFINACGFVAHECSVNCPICTFAKEIKDLLILAFLVAVFVFDPQKLCSCSLGYSEKHQLTLLSRTPVNLKVKISD